MLAQVSHAVGKIAGLLLLAGCSGSSAVGVPAVEFTTPSGVTQISSDSPEIPGAPPPGPPMPATIVTNPAQNPSQMPSQR